MSDSPFYVNPFRGTPTDDVDFIYECLVQKVLRDGVRKENRTGIDTLSVFGLSYRLDVSKKFPLLTSKFVNFEAIVAENLWFLKGEETIKDLQSQGFRFWDAWADEKGVLETSYGRYWRNFPMAPIEAFYVGEKSISMPEEADNDCYDDIGSEYVNDGGIDQVAFILSELRTNPNSRRMVLTAWHPQNAIISKLPPCHYTAVFSVEEGRLNCHLTQRSADIALGVPFNIAGYALLMYLFAKETGLKPGIFSHTLVDAHIYVNHVEAITEQIQRDTFTPPVLSIADKPLSELQIADITLSNYTHGPKIKFEVAV